MTARPTRSERLETLLGLLGMTDRPSIDAVGLRTTYSAWCRAIPFDNLQKLIALRADVPVLPGMKSDGFFASWEADGTGGTCWATNNALHDLLGEIGFDAALWSASMFDGPANHGTTIVTIGDQRWIVDTAIHGDVPAPLIEGETTTVTHAGYQTNVRHDDNGHIVDHPTPDPGFVIPCRILSPMEYYEAVEANERSKTWSPFNDGVMAAINDPTGVWMLKDSILTRIDESGSTTKTISASEADEFLIDIVGCSPRIVALLRSSS